MGVLALLAGFWGIRGPQADLRPAVAAKIAEDPGPVVTDRVPKAKSAADSFEKVAFLDEEVDEEFGGEDRGLVVDAVPGVADWEHEFDAPRSRSRFEVARQLSEATNPGAAPRLAEWRDPADGLVDAAGLTGPVRVDYTLDEELTARVFKILRRGRVDQGTAIVLDPRDGRILSYVSTDEAVLPADKAYPAASIVKVLTASALLERYGSGSAPDCRYRGNKYRLNRRRLERPKDGHEASLETALATSNNQCFAQWALHAVGEPRLRATFARFGWLDSPAPGHARGLVDAVESDLDLGRLGSGLDGVRVTPLHVAQLASILTTGQWVEPWWVDRVVDAYGRPVPRPPRRPNRVVLSRDVAEKLRSMMVATTKRGTAKSAFRDRRGRPRVGSIEIAGKTGNLSGRDPSGRYEWFMGLAPAEDPKVAVVILQLQGHRWWKKSTELASDVFRAVFCDRGGCRAEVANRLTADRGGWETAQAEPVERPRALASMRIEESESSSF